MRDRSRTTGNHPKVNLIRETSKEILSERKIDFFRNPREKQKGGWEQKGWEALGWQPQRISVLFIFFFGLAVTPSRFWPWQKKTAVLRTIGKGPEKVSEPNPKKGSNRHRNLGKMSKQLDLGQVHCLCRATQKPFVAFFPFWSNFFRGLRQGHPLSECYAILEEITQLLVNRICGNRIASPCVQRYDFRSFITWQKVRIWFGVRGARHLTGNGAQAVWHNSRRRK